MAPPRQEKRGSIVPCVLLVEVGILGGTAALAYQLEFTDAFPVHAGGFFCRDPDFGRPDPGPPGASRAPPGLVYALVSAVPALTMAAGELLGRLGGSRGGRAPPQRWARSCERQGAPLRRLLRFLGVFSFGLLATAIFANAGQVVLGTPAPHFLAVCRPNYSALGCAPPAPPPRFVPPGGSPCSGDPPAVAAARRDFPCKEAALGAYAGAFAGLYVTLAWRGSVYVTLAWRGGGSRLAKPAAVLGFAAPPFLLGALRVAEHRNSWGGVLGGFLCGTAIAAFLVTCVVGNFQNQGGDLGWGAGTPRAPRAAPPKPPTPPGGDQRHPGASGGVPSGDLRDPKNREPQKSGTPKIGNPEFGGAWEKTGIAEFGGILKFGVLKFGIAKFGEF
ncbi:phospholipid phosphatase-related protein type 2 [Camarhynchus parvulus]|uniref:phospholipid phosphatase-related protein type 2 n=1 Tax=Geospiza parvula TaxID=87175 RepID=UPI001237FCEB|nr:phospholipid phosphatase-related protein type 2 [Camarhynchus parvulus]